MTSNKSDSPKRFRIWIVQYDDDWRPRHWRDVPLAAVVREPADTALFDCGEATAYLEGYNEQMLMRRGGLWAVAAPVAERREGDFQPGKVVLAARLFRPPMKAD